MTDNIKILESIKPIDWLSNGTMTTKMASEYLEISYNTILTYLSNSKDEFEQLGMKNLTKEEALENNIAFPKNGKIRALNGECLVKLATMARTSKVSAKFREALLDEGRGTAGLAVEEFEIFSSEEFGEVRIIKIENKPYFMATDIALALGYSNPRKAISDHCVGVTKRDALNFNGGLLQDVSFIPEGDVYRLIIRSKLPSAQKFERWLFDEVLPTIRNKGAYMTPETIEEALLNPDFIIKLAQELKDEKIRNSELTATNKALAEEVRTWDFKSVLNALIRSYATQECSGRYGQAWNEFYRQLKYKAHIDLKIRKGKDKAGKGMLDQLNIEESKIAIAVATEMCEGANLNTGHILRHVGVN